MTASRIRSSVGALPPAAADTCERLRAARLRTTAPRLRVLQVLEAAAEPMPAETLFRTLIARGVRIGVGTVYRVLADLSTAQMLQRVWVPGHAGAKAAYSLLRPSSAVGINAHRLVCGRCGHCESFVDPGL